MKKSVKKMKNVILSAAALIFVVLSPVSLAAGGGGDLDDVYTDLSDKASLQRGARLFVNYCLSCHSASYMRYNRMAEDLDMSEEVVMENLMFAGNKIGDLMTTTMPAEDAKKWFGVTPPDLSLAARSRGPEWLYTYLRSFYLDPESVSGWNNTLFPHVAMPHALYELQGSQRLRDGEDQGGTTSEDGHGDSSSKFEMQIPGKLTSSEYDAAMRDLTNFMVYLGEPAKLSRYNIGLWVLIFIGLFAWLAYALKKEYWRDVHGDSSH